MNAESQLLYNMMTRLASTGRTCLLIACLFLANPACQSAVVSFSLPEVTALQNEPIDVPITVSGFNGVTSVQFTLEWTSGALGYIETRDWNLRGFGAGHVGYLPSNPNRITVAWEDPEGTGLSLNNGDAIFSIRFNPTAASLLEFANTPLAREVTIGFAEETFAFDNGSVGVEPIPEPINLALGIFGGVFFAVATYRKIRRKP